MSGPTNKTSAALARGLANKDAALALRRAGNSYRLIAEKLECSRSYAHKMVSEALEDAKAQVAAHADDLRSEEISRLDGMLSKLYPKAEEGDVQAIDRVLKIGERRARLLGLDAPIRTALQGGGEDAPPIVSEARVMVYIPDNGRGAGSGGG